MSNYHNFETADGCSCGPERSNKLQLKKTGYKRTKHNEKEKNTDEVFLCDNKAVQVTCLQ